MRASSFDVFDRITGAKWVKKEHEYSSLQICEASSVESVFKMNKINETDTL